MNLLFSCKRPIDRALEFLLVVTFFVLFICVIIQVFSRYVMNDPSIFTEETSRFAIIWLSLLGTAYACGRLEHIAYTMFPERLKGQHFLTHMRSVAIVVLVFAIGVMLYGGTRLVMRALDYEQLSATLEIPMGYIYLCIPISGLLITYYQILILARPQNFKVADEVEAAIEHITEEEQKLNQ